MRGILTPLLLLVSILFAPTLAYAQATLARTVRDTSGAVQPGVTVEDLESRAHRKSTHGRNGRYGARRSLKKPATWTWK